MNEIEMRYKGIRGLVSLGGSEKETSRGCFTGIDDDLVSFAGRGLDEVVEVFRRTVDEYLAGHATAEVMLRRVAPLDPMENGGEIARRHGFWVLGEPGDGECGESLDDLLCEAERLGFRISGRLRDRDPGEVMESIEGAFVHGVERAYNDNGRVPGNGLQRTRKSGHLWCRGKGGSPMAAAASLS